MYFNIHMLSAHFMCLLSGTDGKNLFAVTQGITSFLLDFLLIANQIFYDYQNLTTPYNPVQKDVIRQSTFFHN